MKKIVKETRLVITESVKKAVKEYEYFSHETDFVFHTSMILKEKLKRKKMFDSFSFYFEFANSSVRFDLVVHGKCTNGKEIMCLVEFKHLLEDNKVFDDLKIGNLGEFYKFTGLKLTSLTAANVRGEIRKDLKKMIDYISFQGRNLFCFGIQVTLSNVEWSKDNKVESFFLEGFDCQGLKIKITEDVVKPIKRSVELVIDEHFEFSNIVNMCKDYLNSIHSAEFSSELVFDMLRQDESWEDCFYHFENYGVNKSIFNDVKLFYSKVDSLAGHPEHVRSDDFRLFLTSIDLAS